jgi:hypothetical protein
MESFTLGSNPKIDFSCSTATAHLQWLKREQISSNNFTEYLSKLWRNSIPNSCSSQCLGASIYRLRFKWATTMKYTGAVRTVDKGRPDGQLCDKNVWDFRWKSFLFENHVRMDNCATKIQKISLKSFLFESRVRTVRHCRPDGRTSAASNFHIKLWRVRTKGDGRPDDWSWIRNFHICWTCVRTKLTDIWTVVFELRFLPYVWASPDGNSRRPDSCIILPLFELGKYLKLIDHWTSSGRATESSGRIQVGTEASRYSEGFGRKYTLSERMMLDLSGVRTVWHVVQIVGTVDRWASRRDDTSSGQLTGNRFFWLVTSAESLKYFWIVESLWRSSLHTSNFVLNRMRPITN